MSEVVSLPDAVVRAYGIDAETARHVPSLINDTYVVEAGVAGQTRTLVVQRLHPVFGPEVHQDIEAVTRWLEARGLETPRLVPTSNGDLYSSVADADGPGIWRALTFVPGVTRHQSRDPKQLRSGAQLLARFHGALRDLTHEFASQRPLHDTARHFEVLEGALASNAASRDEEAQRLGAEVLAHAQRVTWSFDAQPRRVTHGDPKLSNLLFFAEDETRARCLIDLDTVGRGCLAHELGDALRSWCNPTGEDHAEAKLETPLFDAVVEGYLEVAGDRVDEGEAASFVYGLETISCELASRFAADAILDCYFGWDATRFPNRRAHNLVRARGQLALSKSVGERRTQLLDRVAELRAGLSRRA